MKITLQLNEIAAAILFASTDETRYVLCGCNIEMRPGKQPLIVATNGRTLCAISTAAKQESDCAEPCSAILSRRILETILRLTPKKRKVVDVEIGAPDVSGSQSLICPCSTEITISAKCIFGQFPNWRLTVPINTATATGDISLNSELVSLFGRAAKALGVEAALRLRFRDKGGVVEIKLSKAQNFFGLLMPMNGGGEEIWQPDFLDLPKPAPLPSVQSKAA